MLAELSSVSVPDSDEDLSLALSLLVLLLLSLSPLADALEPLTVLVVLELVEVTLAPSLVWVVLFTTTLVAPRARTNETKAKGVTNGGVFAI